MRRRIHRMRSIDGLTMFVLGTIVVYVAIFQGMVSANDQLGRIFQSNFDMPASLEVYGTFVYGSQTEGFRSVVSFLTISMGAILIAREVARRFEGLASIAFAAIAMAGLYAPVVAMAWFLGESSLAATVAPGDAVVGGLYALFLMPVAFVAVLCVYVIRDGLRTLGGRRGDPSIH